MSEDAIQTDAEILAQLELEEAAKAAEAEAADREAAKAVEAAAAAEAEAEAVKAAKAAAKLPAAPEGCVYLRHSEGIGCSFRGVELVADKKGFVLAPAHAAEELAAHGFIAIAN